MKEAIKNIFLLGLGAERVTRKKADDSLKAFIKQKAITKKQAKELIRHMLCEADKVKDKLRKEGKAEMSAVKSKIKQASKNAKKSILAKASKINRRITRCR